MTRSDIYVLKGHIETERQKIFRKLRDILGDTCLLGALGISRVAKFSPGENIPCEIVPGRKVPPPCISLCVFVCVFVCVCARRYLQSA